jgi:outer membrane lipoprotein SlyB
VATATLGSGLASAAGAAAGVLAGLMVDGRLSRTP